MEAPRGLKRRRLGLLRFGRNRLVRFRAVARLRLALAQILAKRRGEPLRARLARASAGFAKGWTRLDPPHRGPSLVTGPSGVKPGSRPLPTSVDNIARIGEHADRGKDLPIGAGGRAWEKSGCCRGWPLWPPWQAACSHSKRCCRASTRRWITF